MILLDGRDITRAAPDDRGMGIVFQNYALFENMTVLGNVEYALKFKPELRGDRRAIATSVLEQIGLIDLMDRGVRDLSGGQQQRVCIARTLALNPKIILFDEPMSALDVEARLSLRAELKRIQGEFGTTMIYITHDQEEAFALSDRIMVMGGGSYPSACRSRGDHCESGRRLRVGIRRAQPAHQDGFPGAFHGQVGRDACFR